MTLDAVVGSFQLAEGMTGNALWLDGNSTIDIFIPGTSGCWRQVSTCQAQGFSLAFWIKVISDSGFENHQDKVGVVTAMRAWGKEGWKVKLSKLNSNWFLRMHVADMQNPEQHAWKEHGSLYLFYH